MQKKDAGAPMENKAAKVADIAEAPQVAEAPTQNETAKAPDAAKVAQDVAQNKAAKVVEKNEIPFSFVPSKTTKEYVQSKAAKERVPKKTAVPSMKYTEMSCKTFIERLASQDPVPGGGSVAALVGALGAALGNMVGSLTLGKKKYAEVADEIQEAMTEVSVLKVDLIELVQKDIDIFEPISRILAQKPETDDGFRDREERLEVALEEACMVPIMVMEKCGRVVELCKIFAEKGNRIAVSDAAAGAILCKSAIEAASLNVYINTSMMKKKENIDRLNNVCARHLMMYTPLAEGVFGYVSHRLQTNEA